MVFRGSDIDFLVAYFFGGGGGYGGYLWGTRAVYTHIEIKEKRKERKML